jgi:hypothetical protein
MRLGIITQGLNGWPEDKGNWRAQRILGSEKRNGIPWEAKLVALRIHKAGK